MEKTYIVNVDSINYAIEDEDICEYVEDLPTIEEQNKEADRIRKNILSKLPQQLVLEITCEKEDLEDMVINEVTEMSGWLIYGCTYHVA